MVMLEPITKKKSHDAKRMLITRRRQPHIPPFPTTKRQSRNRPPYSRRFFSPGSQLVLSQTLPHTSSASFPKVLVLALPLLAEHPSGLDVSRALVVGAMEQADGAEQDGLGSLNRGPAF